MTGLYTCKSIAKMANFYYEETKLLEVAVHLIHM